MTSAEFWQSWAAAQFGAAAGSGAASLFNRSLILRMGHAHTGKAPTLPDTQHITLWRIGDILELALLTPITNPT